MPQCVQSSNNRYFAAVEGSYGQIPSISADNQFSATQLRVQQSTERRVRRDKTGSRTYSGVAPGSRRLTNFELEVYHTGSLTPDVRPRFDPLVRSAMGASPLIATSQSVGSSSTATVLNFPAAHGLVAGQAIVVGDEIRFVKQVISTTSVETNAPYTAAPGGVQTASAASYFPAAELQSVTLFDYWEPQAAVSRLVHGAVCDSMTIEVNADFHSFRFAGGAQGVVDSTTFAAGQGGLGSFPTMPATPIQFGQPIPGNLGQAWIGSPVNQFVTVVAATLNVSNDVRLRADEFGSSAPQCIVAGARTVSLDLEILEADDAATRELYTAAVAELAIPVMFQLGTRAGQLSGVYMRAVVPDVPEFDDSDRLLHWRFRAARATGAVDDEISVAFG